MRAKRYNLRGRVERYSEAARLVERPGDCAIVTRGDIQRQMVMRCPDGCGDTLSINLDARSGKAWRVYERRGRCSLFPSVDRPTGCQSHFILWHGHVLWCDYDDGQEPAEVVSIDPNRILSLLANGPAHYAGLADQLDEVPWDVLSACRHLVKVGHLKEGDRSQYGVFWISQGSGV